MKTSTLVAEWTRILCTAIAMFSSLAFLCGQEKIGPLAVTEVNGFQIGVWSVDSIDATKLKTQMGKPLDLDSKRFGGEREFGAFSTKKLPNSHILGLQVRSATGEVLPAAVDVVQGYRAVDDLEGKSYDSEFSSNRYAYQWDRPFLAPIPVGVSAGAKEIVKLEGLVAVSPSLESNLTLTPKDFSGKEPVKSSLFAVIVASVKNEAGEVVLSYSLFSPEAKQEGGSGIDRLTAMMNGLHEEVRATLIDEAGNAYQSTRNTALNVQRKFDTSMMRTLQKDLTMKMKENDSKNRSAGSKANVKVTYELNINNYQTSFSKLPPNLRIKEIQLRMIKPTAPTFPLRFTLEHIPLDSRRTTTQLELACKTRPVEGSGDDVAFNMTKEKIEVVAEKDGIGKRVQATVGGNGSTVKSSETFSSPGTAIKSGSSKGLDTSQMVEESAKSDLFSPNPKFQEGKGYRFWKDASGSFSVEAMLVDSDGTDVQLRKRDGKTIKVPIKKLSEIDQTFLKK